MLFFRICENKKQNYPNFHKSKQMSYTVSFMIIFHTSCKSQILNKQEVLRRTNSLLSFHCNLSI
jgi:hypothetical protein